MRPAIVRLHVFTVLLNSCTLPGKLHKHHVKPIPRWWPISYIWLQHAARQSDNCIVDLRFYRLAALALIFRLDDRAFLLGTAELPVQEHGPLRVMQAWAPSVKVGRMLLIQVQDSRSLPSNAFERVQFCFERNREPYQRRSKGQNIESEREREIEKDRDAKQCVIGGIYRLCMYQNHQTL